MADYYPLLRRAISSLDRPDDERARYDVYERARKALLHQLEATGASDADANAQLDAMRTAAARIEDEIAAQSGSSSPPPPPAPTRGAPVRRAPQSVQPPVDRSAEAAAMLRRRPTGMILLTAALAAFLLAGLGVYYVAFRDRTRPAPRTEATRTVPAARPQTSPQAEAVDQNEASYVLRRQRVFYRTTHPPGTIIVSRSQRFLYLVQPNQVAIRYAIGTGPDCENVSGLFHITEKLSVSPKGPPSGTAPPPFRLGEQFGPRAVYFDATRAVHGTAQPHQIGESAPAGCFLSWTPDIVDLYDRVQLNDRVVVTN